MLDALVIGADSFIGAGLLRHLTGNVLGTSRRLDQDSFYLDLLDVPDTLPAAKTVYICAAMTRFIDCEAERTAYRINVDAPISIVRACSTNWPAPGNVIFLSSEAVERANATRYGTYKAMAELGLRTVCNPHIVRLSKVTDLDECCKFLISVADKPPGIYHWKPQSSI